MPVNPKRGEVWFVNFDPTQGAEIQKTRRVVVVSAEGVGTLPLRLVVPFTAWNHSFIGKAWLVNIKPSIQSGLTKDSAADVFQMRSVDLSRFGSGSVGNLSSEEMQDIAEAVAVAVDYKSAP